MGQQPFYFYNPFRRNMTFDDVVRHMYEFIKQEPRAVYQLSIGTDSQVHGKETQFITAIHIHRIGNGAWGCLKKYVVPRKMMNLHEKISLETSLSEEVSLLFTETQCLMLLTNPLIPFIDEGADLNLEIHLDIGEKGKTKKWVPELTERITAMGIGVKIKPDSFAASSYANRYTK